MMMEKKKNLKPTPNKKSKVIDTATPKESPESSSNLRDPNEEINKLDIKNQKEWEDIIKTFDFNGAGKMLVKKHCIQIT